MEVINPHWMEEMLGNCQRKEVGIVGAKLYYPDDTIQHAGTIIGIGGIAGHAFLNMPPFEKWVSSQSIFADGSERSDCRMYDDEANCF